MAACVSWSTVVRWDGLAVLALLWTTSAIAQPTPAPTCKIFDRELQGRYSGGCVNGLAEGWGKADGIALYDGSFSAGKKHGRGTKSWPASGDHYEGEFVDDRKEGIGIYTWGHSSAWPGEKYSGRFINDMRHSLGTYEWPGGDRYTGPWEYDQPVGAALPAMRARARAYLEAKAAVSRPGISVCREMKVGIVTLERIHGTVAAAREEHIEVRIDYAGLMGHVIRGVDVHKDVVVKDDFPNWSPC